MGCLSETTFLLLCTGSEDNDVALPGFFVCTGANVGAGVAVEGCIGQVLDLCVSYFFLGVNHEDVPSYRVHDERVGDCSADIAGTDDGDRGGKLRV